MTDTDQWEPEPDGATWVVRDPTGRIVEYSTEPIVLEMTAELGESFGLSPEQQPQQEA